MKIKNHFFLHPHIPSPCLQTDIFKFNPSSSPSLSLTLLDLIIFSTFQTSIKQASIIQILLTMYRDFSRDNRLMVYSQRLKIVIPLMLYFRPCSQDTCSFCIRFASVHMATMCYKSALKNLPSLSSCIATLNAVHCLALFLTKCIL